MADSTSTFLRPFSLVLNPSFSSSRSQFLLPSLSFSILRSPFPPLLNPGFCSLRSLFPFSMAHLAGETQSLVFLPFFRLSP